MTTVPSMDWHQLSILLVRCTKPRSSPWQRLSPRTLTRWQPVQRSAPASLVASPVPPSERPVGILPGRRGRGQIELLIAGMAVSMAVFAPVIAPAAVAAFMFTRRDARGRRGQLAVGTRTRRECARTVEPGAGALAEWAGAGEGSDLLSPFNHAVPSCRPHVHLPGDPRRA